MKEQSLREPIKEKLKGVSRRDFMKFCGVMAVSMGLPFCIILLGVVWCLHRQLAADLVSTQHGAASGQFAGIKKAGH